MTDEESDVQAVLTLLRESAHATELRTSETIATELGLPIERVERTLKSLETVGQVKRAGLDMWAPT
jgi:predicted transcriptional regulator